MTNRWELPETALHMGTAWLIVVGLGAGVIGAATPQSKIPAPETQTAMNERAGAMLRTAEFQMASLLERLMSEAAGSSGSIKLLNDAQVAWVSYRDAQLAAEWPNPSASKYGSVFPMCLSNERTRLTELRIVELRSMLKPAEGDACAPQWPE